MVLFRSIGIVPTRILTVMICFFGSMTLCTPRVTTTSHSIARKCTTSEYTWTGADGNTYAYEPLKENTCGADTVCASPYPRPGGTDERVPPVDDDVDIQFIGLYHPNSTNTTCLEVGYSLSRWSAEKFKGIQFLLVGHGYNSHNKGCCQILNYTTPLSYDALYLRDKVKRFVFNCFCDLWPSEEYTLTIRTLPVDFDNQTLLDDSSFVKNIDVPGCNDRSWDQHCERSKEELWRPQMFDLQQNFPNYTVMSVTFNIAPMDYRLVKYVINLYESGNPRPLKYETVHLSTGQFFEVKLGDLLINATTVFFNVADKIGKNIHSGIFPQCEDWESDCATSHINVEEEEVTLIANPCDSNPCGELGSCVPDRATYNCTCNSNAINNGTMCIANPCASKPCGELGSCVPDRATYNCTCNSNAINIGSTCVEIKGNLRKAVLIGVCSLVLLLLLAGCGILLRRYWRQSRLYPVNPDVKPISDVPDEFHNDRRVLIMYTNDLKDVVCKFAIFLKSHVGVEPVLWCQHKEKILRKGLESWLCHEKQRASKVLFLCSRGTRETWEAGNNGLVTNLGQSEFGNVFQTMLTISKHERVTPGMKSKFLTAYFGDCSSHGDVPDVLNDLPCYNLMGNSEEMCFNLLELEQDTPTSRRRMPKITHFRSHREGEALLEAIEEIKKHYTSYYPKSGAMNLESCLNSIELEMRDIPPDENLQRMATVKAIFSMTDTESDSEESSSCLGHSA